MSARIIMKYSLILTTLLLLSPLSADDDMKVIGSNPQSTTTDSDMNSVAQVNAQNELLTDSVDLHLSVVGQGVAPMNTDSPAQAYALAKRAAIADGYRLIAEKIKGVRVDGQDVIKNMMVKRSTVRTAVQAIVKNANVVETNYKDGLCEVEMEIILSHSQFVQ